LARGGRRGRLLGEGAFQRRALFEEIAMQNPKRRLSRKLLWTAVLLVASLALLPAYVGAYTLSGTSIAPTLLLGDHVLVNRGAYDIRLPYSDHVLLPRGNPALGDLVLVACPDDGRLIFKRIAALPGDRVAMHEHHLSINGSPLTYTALDRTANTVFAGVAAENGLGSVIETEVLGLHAHLISYTPGSPRKSFPEALVPPDHYYLLGDNRDESRDSRAWGPVPRQSIRGRVVWQPHRR
jgi:signal peptidase I